MDSTNIVSITELLKSIDVSTLAVITGILGFFHPWITDLVNALWFDDIKSDKLRKSVIFLFGAVFGFIATLGIDWLGDFHLPIFICFLIGTGLYTTIGEGTYRLRNHFSRDGDYKPLIQSAVGEDRREQKAEFQAQQVAREEKLDVKP